LVHRALYMVQTCMYMFMKLCTSLHLYVHAMYVYINKHICRYMYMNLPYWCTMYIHVHEFMSLYVHVTDMYIDVDIYWTRPGGNSGMSESRCPASASLCRPRKPVETTVCTMYIHCTYIVYVWFIHWPPMYMCTN
jgi:hypothetical protein